MSGPTLWDDPAAGVAARDEAMSRVEERSAPWRAVAWDVLMDLARTRETLTSDDLFIELERRHIPRPVEARAAGPVMQRGIREGVLVPIGYTAGRDPRHHRDVARLYRSGLR